MNELNIAQRIRSISEWLDSKVEIGSSSFDLAPGPVSQFDFELSEAAHGLMLIAADLDRAALAAQPGAVGWTHWEARIKQLMEEIGQPHSRSVYQAFSQLVNEVTRLAAAPTEAKPAQQDAVDAEALRFAEMSMAAMRDALMPAFEYVGVSLRISQEDHAAIRSALAGMSTSLHMVRAAISAKKGGA